MKAIYIILALVLSSCSSIKMDHVYKNSDFMGAQKPYSQSWTGGAPGSGNGYTLYFPAQITNGQSVAAVYYKEMISKTVNYVSDNKEMMVTRFSVIPQDIIMDSDTQKEYSNQAPSLKKFPFELKSNEAVIALKTETNELTYIKLENIEEREHLNMPSRPR